MFLFFFFFNDTATTEIYTLSLHDALPIFNRLCSPEPVKLFCLHHVQQLGLYGQIHTRDFIKRSEEHTSELQSRQYLVCRLLLEKKKKNIRTQTKQSL